MTKARSFLAAMVSTLAILAFIDDLRADCHAVVVRRGFGHHVVANHVVHHAAAAVYAPYPVYSVGANYAGHDNGAAVVKAQLDVVSQNAQAMLAQNQVLLALLQGKLPPGVAGAAQGQAPPAKASGGLELIQKNCAACHTGASSKGGLALFGDDGQPNAKLTSQQLGEVIGRLTTANPAKVMPPPNSSKSPSFEERLRMVSLFVGEPGQQAKAGQ